ncbi:hypothetical protein [Fulvivirga sp.]|uniref:hypothetical protein n=1 Tax=Fulvivirga sp. TaxID=1931237 RepID=UPI0032EB6894
MDSEEQGKINIPKEFYSFSTGAPFERCIECDKNLQEGEQEYFIEKAIKQYEGFSAHDVIFEYAICLACAERMRKSMSVESMKSIELYFSQNLDFGRRIKLIQDNIDNPIAWMDECLLKGTQKNTINEYQIYAHCKGNHLDTSQMPYMVSGAALEEISSLLSNETLDELDGFSQKHFGPPPGLENTTPVRRVVLI